MSEVPEGFRAEILEADECWRYLRSSYFGRLALINGSAPEIFPDAFEQPSITGKSPNSNSGTSRIMPQVSDLWPYNSPLTRVSLVPVQRT